MTEIMPTYFDALPLHTQPEPFESLTSYLIRLAETNGIASISALTPLCFPELTDSRAPLRLIRDYPPASLRVLEKVSRCSKTRLLQTTYYHLGKKFGRSIQYPLPPTHFLSGSISKSFRYCPECLTCFPYYSLLWRFLILEGCHKHSCRLLNECRHCGRPIPLFPPLLRISICPSCNGDLSQCQSEPLAERERIEALNAALDIEFVLTPQGWELTSGSIAERLGQEFRLLRQKKNISGENVKRILGISPRSYILRSIERGICIGGSFQQYMQYARYLGTTLRDIFSSMLRRREGDEELELLRKRDLRSDLLSEEDILERLELAADMLRSLGEQVTQRKVSDAVHMSQVNICKYPKVRQFFQQLSHEVRNNSRKQKHLHEKDILEEAREAIQHLEERGELITYLGVAKSIGMQAQSLKHYPSVDLLLKQKAHQYDFRIQRERQREEDLFQIVEITIQQMKSSGQRVTQGVIAKLTGVSLSTLKSYERVRTILEQETYTTTYTRQRITQAHQHEEKLIAHIKDVILNLESSGQPVTQKVIAKLVGKQLSLMRKYPGARALLDEKPFSHYPQLHSSLKEEDLIAKVKMIVEELDFPGEKALYDEIGRRICLHPALLKECPEVTALVELAAQEQELQREKVFLTKAEIAVRELKALGQPITLTTIGRWIGARPNTFHRYPSVEAFVQKAVRESRQEACAEQFQQREEEWVRKVLDAVQQLQPHKRPISVTAIAKYIHTNTTTLSRYPKVQHILDNIVITPGRPRKSR